MKEQVEARDNPGVYALDGRGRETLVHLYQGGDYELADIVEFFQLGRLEEADGEDETVLVLTAKELRTLKTMADAYSFDYQEPFIEMCLEMRRFADQFGGGPGGPAGTEMRFTANF